MREGIRGRQNVIFSGILMLVLVMAGCSEAVIGPARNTIDLFRERNSGPRTRFVYVGSSVGLNILDFDPDTGAASPTAASPITIATGLRELCMSPDERFLYATNGTGNTVYGWSIDQTSGDVTAIPGTPVTVDASLVAQGCAVRPDGAVLYAYGSGSPPAENNFQYWSIDATTGQLTTVAPQSVDGGSLVSDVAIDQASSSLYFVGGQDLYRMSIASNGALTVANGPINIGASTASLQLAEDDTRLYIAALTTGTIIPYDVSGTPVAITPTTVVGSAWSLGFSPDDSFLYVSTSTSSELLTFEVATDGTVALSAFPSLALNDRANRLAFGPGGEYLFASDDAGTGGALRIYAQDAATGELTEAPGSPVPTGDNPFGLAFIAQ